MGARGWPEWVARLIWQPTVEISEDRAGPAFVLTKSGAAKPLPEPKPELQHELIAIVRELRGLILRR
jgi:hypothetical protein